LQEQAIFPDPSMFLLHRPTPEQIDRVLDTQRVEPLSYPAPGMTRSSRPPGFLRNHHETLVGSGPETYLRAVAAVQRWAMYDLPWTEVYPAKMPIHTGGIFATVVRHLGFWSINPCRIVYVEEEESATLRTFSFAIGTLPLHSERGEERFLVEWDRARDAVRFEILAYASPHHWMARLGGPFVRILQRRFGRDALQAVRAHVEHCA
jgi:uncharacterized protein (UPF0548 family)